MLSRRTPTLYDFCNPMPLDDQKFRTETSVEGFLEFAFLAGASDRAAARPVTPHRHPASMHDTLTSYFTDPLLQANGFHRLDISRAGRAFPLPPGLITAEK